MTTKFTPGPWCARGNIIKQDFAFIGLGEGPIIASVTGGKTSGPFFIESEEEVAANALLIAAAPDLLEALIAAVSVADRATVEFDKARSAIAKATGQEA